MVDEDEEIIIVSPASGPSSKDDSIYVERRFIESTGYYYNKGQIEEYKVVEVEKVDTQVDVVYHITDDVSLSGKAVYKAEDGNKVAGYGAGPDKGKKKKLNLEETKDSESAGTQAGKSATDSSSYIVNQAVNLFSLVPGFITGRTRGLIDRRISGWLSKDYPITYDVRFSGIPKGGGDKRCQEEYNDYIFDNIGVDFDYSSQKKEGNIVLDVAFFLSNRCDPVFIKDVYMCDKGIKIELNLYQKKLIATITAKNANFSQFSIDSDLSAASAGGGKGYRAHLKFLVDMTNFKLDTASLDIV